MKKIIFYLFFLLQSAFICSVDNEHAFEHGNQLFLQGNYARACYAYKTIENKGFSVLYNLGLSYLHQNNRPQAVLYGKRAEKQASFRQLTQLYELFDCMNRQVDPNYALGWYEQLAIFLKKCILSISILLLQICLSLVIILLIICWYRRWYKIYKRLFLFIISFCVLLFSVWWYKNNMMQQQVGIVTKDLIYVFAGPDESFYKKSELHESDAVIIIRKQQKYYQVQAKQVVGWIHDKDIELV